jgi:UPF0716 protein FxsA
VYLLIIFILVPIIEIALFIQVGGLIGLWPTLVCVVVTAVVGTALLRRQGLQVLQQAQTSMRNDGLPVEAVMHGAFLLVSGLLLLTPGFFTDAIGFLLLVPPLRLLAAQFIWQRLRGNVHVYASGPGQAGSGRPGGSGTIIDGEATEVETPQEPVERIEEQDNRSDPPDPDSPWHR